MTKITILPHRALKPSPVSLACEFEQKLREAEIKEQTTAEQKRHDPERDEYRYTFARVQQLARISLPIETARAGKDLADRTSRSKNNPNRFPGCRLRLKSLPAGAGHRHEVHRGIVRFRIPGESSADASRPVAPARAREITDSNFLAAARRADFARESKPDAI